MSRSPLGVVPMLRARRVRPVPVAGRASPGAPRTRIQAVAGRSRRTGRRRPARSGPSAMTPAASRASRAAMVPSARMPWLELEQLHGPLDVGERAPPELEVELRVLAGGDPLALDAGLHPRGSPGRRRSVSGAPHRKGSTRLGEAPARRPGRRRRTGPGAGPGVPTPGPTGRSRRRRRPGCGPAGPAGPRGAGRGRRSRAGWPGSSPFR